MYNLPVPVALRFFYGILSNLGPSKELIPCPNGEFRCNEPIFIAAQNITTDCIPISWVCDYGADCPDASDEHADCEPPPCNLAERFACKTYKFRTPYCLPLHQKCDKIIDCEDGSDELPSECLAEYRKCEPGDHICDPFPGLVKGQQQCFNQSAVNDNLIDCRSVSDENFFCSPGDFFCADRKSCMSKWYRCNTRDDCDDGSDEEGCNWPECRKDNFKCEGATNFACLAARDRCHDNWICNDGNGDYPCPITCPEGQALCPHGLRNGRSMCINESQACDGKSNCHDDYDETEMCKTTNCPTLNCEHNCKESVHGGVCTCNPGYNINPSNTSDCVPHNECEEWGYCSQTCQRNSTSYTCGCLEGYHLEKAGRRRCIADEPASIYYIKDKKIIRLVGNNDQYHEETLIKTTHGKGLDFHWRKDLLFWSDIETGKVYSAKLSDLSPASVKSGAEIAQREYVANATINAPRPWALVSIAVDWLHDKLYVADKVGERIDVFDIDTATHERIILENIGLSFYIGDIAVDPEAGYLFVAEQDFLGRSKLNGTDFRELVKFGYSHTNGIALDRFRKRVFWTRHVWHEYILETVDYEGRDMRSFKKDIDAEHMTFYNSQLYMLAINKQAVYEVDFYRAPSEPEARPTQTISSIYNLDAGAIVAIGPGLQTGAANDE